MYRITQQEAPTKSATKDRNSGSKAVPETNDEDVEEQEIVTDDDPNRFFLPSGYMVSKRKRPAVLIPSQKILMDFTNERSCFMLLKLYTHWRNEDDIVPPGRTAVDIWNERFSQLPLEIQEAISRGEQIEQTILRARKIDPSKMAYHDEPTLPQDSDNEDENCRKNIVDSETSDTDCFSDDDEDEEMDEKQLASDQTNGTMLPQFIMVRNGARAKRMKQFINLQLAKLEDEKLARRAQSRAMREREIGNMKMAQKMMDDFRKLNNKQELAMRIVVDAFQSEASMEMSTMACPDRRQLKMIVTGSGGTGKSFLIQNIVNYARHYYADNAGGKYGPVLVTAYTGAAAYNVNGVTLHSAFKLKKTNKENERTGSRKEQALQSELRGVRVLIIDEYSMVSPAVLHQVHTACIQARLGDVTKRFCGIHVIMFGDFYQLPPVAQQSLYVESNHAGRKIWEEFDHAIELTEQQRQTEGRFIEILNNCRLGQLTHDEVRYLNTKCRVTTHQAASLIVPPNTLWAAAVNAKVEESNMIHLDRLIRLQSAANLTIFANHFSYSSDLSFPADSDQNSQKSSLESANRDTETTLVQRQSVIALRKALLEHDQASSNINGILPKGELKLAVGARVMLSKNVAVELGLVNGALGTIVGFAYDNSRKERLKKPVKPQSNKEDFLHAPLQYQIPMALIQFDANFYCGESWDTNNPCVVPIGAFEFDLEFSRRKYVRSQLPLQLSWCTTIHKTQGRTLDHMVLHAEKIKQPGQAYVAISRCKTIEGLKVIGELELSMFNLKRERMEQLQTEMNRIRGLEVISLAFAKSLDPCLPENDLENTEEDCILDEFLEEESNSNDNSKEDEENMASLLGLEQSRAELINDYYCILNGN